MLLVGILVKVEVAVSLIELALLPVKRSVGLFSKKRNYPFGTATSSNFWTLQSPLRVSPPWSTRPWKAGSMTASHMAGLSSLLFLRRVPDPPSTSFLIVPARYQEHLHQLCICTSVTDIDFLLVAIPSRGWVSENEVIPVSDFQADRSRSLFAP